MLSSRAPTPRPSPSRTQAKEQVPAEVKKMLSSQRIGQYVDDQEAGIRYQKTRTGIIARKIGF